MDKLIEGHKNSSHVKIDDTFIYSTTDVNDVLEESKDSNPQIPLTKLDRESFEPKLS